MAKGVRGLEACAKYVCTMSPNNTFGLYDKRNTFFDMAVLRKRKSVMGKLSGLHFYKIFLGTYRAVFVETLPSHLKYISDE